MILANRVIQTLNAQNRYFYILNMSLTTRRFSQLFYRIEPEEPSCKSVLKLKVRRRIQGALDI